MSEHRRGIKHHHHLKKFTGAQDQIKEVLSSDFIQENRVSILAAYPHEPRRHFTHHEEEALEKSLYALADTYLQTKARSNHMHNTFYMQKNSEVLRKLSSDKDRDGLGFGVALAMQLIRTFLSNVDTRLKGHYEPPVPGRSD